MTDEEFVGRIGRLYEQIIKLKKDDNYVVNQPQMVKFVEVTEFFMDIAKKSNGKVDPIVLSPREEHGGLTATFLVFYIHGDDIAKFSKVISYTSAITIDSTEDGACISVTVPNVFVPVTK